MNSALYAGIVAHARLRPKTHRLRYRVFSLLIDLDEAADLSRRLRYFGFNRRALYSLWDKDHGDGGDMRQWIATQLAVAGITGATQVTMLCYPRILGYVFNPLTVYFCADAEGLRAILYEVHNTFGERRTYVIPATPGASVVTQAAAKEMYVSPFTPMSCFYRFRITPPGKKVVVAIDETDEAGLLLTASFAGDRRELSDAALLQALFAYPLMTLKVTAAIYWEALRLWLKGVPVFRHRVAPARIATTIVTPR